MRLILCLLLRFLLFSPNLRAVFSPARRILNHWTSREVPSSALKKQQKITGKNSAPLYLWVGVPAWEGPGDGSHLRWVDKFRGCSGRSLVPPPPNSGCLARPVGVSECVFTFRAQLCFETFCGSQMPQQLVLKNCVNKHARHICRVSCLRRQSGPDST